MKFKTTKEEIIKAFSFLPGKVLFDETARKNLDDEVELEGEPSWDAWGQCAKHGKVNPSLKRIDCPKCESEFEEEKPKKIGELKMFSMENVLVSRQTMAIFENKVNEIIKHINENPHRLSKR